MPGVGLPGTKGWIWGDTAALGDSVVAGVPWAWLWVQAEQRGPRSGYPQAAGEGGVQSRGAVTLWGLSNSCAQCRGGPAPVALMGCFPSAEWGKLRHGLWLRWGRAARNALGMARPYPRHSSAPPPAFLLSQRPNPARFPRDFGLNGLNAPEVPRPLPPGPSGHKDGLIEWPELAGNKRPLVSRWGGCGDNGDPGAGQAPPERGGVGANRSPAVWGAAAGFGVLHVVTPPGRGSKPSAGICDEGFVGWEEEEG